MSSKLQRENARLLGELRAYQYMYSKEARRHVEATEHLRKALPELKAARANLARLNKIEVEYRRVVKEYEILANTYNAVRAGLAGPHTDWEPSELAAAGKVAYKIAGRLLKFLSEG